MLSQGGRIPLQLQRESPRLESISALAEGLQKFEGTVIVVTHDQELVSEVATRIWSLEGGGKPVHDFTGTFAEFMAKNPMHVQRR